MSANQQRTGTGRSSTVAVTHRIAGRAVDQTNLFRRPRLFRHESAGHASNKR